ncbi:MxaD family protein, partial [Gordonia paraffinivorans]|nr:MxaD family protein [Gordonia paraffinivorans]
YSYIDGPLPLEHYESTISVIETGPATSRIVWAAEFGAASAEVEEDLVTGISEIYSGALDELATKFAG